MVMVMVMARSRKTNSKGGGPWKRFSALSWQRRSAYAAVIVITVLLAVRAAELPLVTVANRSNPVLADRIGSSHKAALTLLMIEGVKDPKVLSSQRIIDAARARLRENPLDAPAMRALAFHYSLVGSKKKSAELAKMASEMSRRERLAQLLLAQDAAEKGDGAVAMEHFDLALRTTESGREQIFELLTKSGDNPEVFAALLPLATDKSAWMPDYLLYSSRNSPTGPKNAAKLLLAGDVNAKRKIIDTVGTEILTLLAIRGEYGDLRQLYGLMSAGRDDITRDARITKQTMVADAGPLAWTAVNDVSVGAAIGNDKAGKTVASAYASRNSGGVAIRRILALPPGTYRLAENRRLLVESDGAKAYWTMKCPSLPGSPVIWTGPQDQVGYSAKGLPGPSISKNCPVQELELNMVGGSALSGVELVIENFNLLR